MAILLDKQGRKCDIIIDPPCCKSISETPGLEEDIFWYDMHYAPPEGVIYQGPRSMRYTFPEDGVSEFDIKRSLERHDRLQGPG